MFFLTSESKMRKFLLVEFDNNGVVLLRIDSAEWLADTIVKHIVKPRVYIKSEIFVTLFAFSEH